MISFGKNKKKSMVFIAFFFAIILGLAILISAFMLIRDLPSPNRLNEPGTIAYSTHIYDRHGKLLYEIYRDQNRTPVKLATLPKHVKWATISIEDKDFYKHGGVSIIGGVVRALKANLTNSTKLQGGSTITQQLVKSALLTPERTIQRKVKEIILALLVERRYNKDEIIEMYLNQVPYGGTAWGIQEASKLYFDKNAQKLSLAQAALLAGLPQAPSLYSPYVNPQAAIDRQHEVLKLMLKENYISQKEYDTAIHEHLTFKRPKNTILAPHFVFYVKQLLEKEYGERRVQEGGLRVYTTLDYDIQKSAEDILDEELKNLKGYNVGNGALMVTRPPTGEILAMIGSKDFFGTASGAYNVTTALRQPGSSIKPLNYAVGIDTHRVTASSMFLDIPTCFAVPGQKGYCPKNYDNTFHGPVQLRFALANSYNIPAVKMLALNGVDTFVASASAFGISTFKDPSRYGLSLTLGGGEVRMTDMARAFSIFPNQGVDKDLVAVLRVEDRNKKELYKYEDRNVITDVVKKKLNYPNTLFIQGPRLIGRDTAFIISHILLDNNARAQAFSTGSLLHLPGHEAVSVKTGTTDDFKDNWTIGFTPNFMTLVWVGNNDGTPMNSNLTSGVTGAAPIWNRVMQKVLKNQPDLWPIQPDTVVGAEVCTISGMRPRMNGDAKSCNTRYEYFAKGTVPAEENNVSTQKVFMKKDSDKIAKEGDTDNVEEKDKIIATDWFSRYCLDCNHENSDFTTVSISSHGQ
ncbi:MAG: transglycosylase domain-containing protein [Candidatus Roizmanbacteria bacterium]|nr:transglycosylase domain-containing protein [Candidatus Roizmanbacteria bacterium]